MVILCFEIGCDETDHIALLGARLQVETIALRRREAAQQRYRRPG
jgi:hypothetical protein